MRRDGWENESLSGRGVSGRVEHGDADLPIADGGRELRYDRCAIVPKNIVPPAIRVWAGSIFR